MAEKNMESVNEEVTIKKEKYSTLWLNVFKIYVNTLKSRPQTMTKFPNTAAFMIGKENNEYRINLETLFTTTE
jgi:demethoxyubiquinone hydroxylase (CLK1/Coq7/Cat5 family)